MSLKKSFLVISVIYIIAFAVAYGVFIACKSLPVLWATLWADIAATLVVWLCGIYYKNSSVYDPYWSVAPLVVFSGWALLSGQPCSLISCLFLIAVFFWGIRLTWNWAINWHGMGHQDWRYIDIKTKNPKNWFFANLMGIHLIPTLVVFLAMIPAYYAFSASTSSPGIITWIGFLICIAAPVIQFISDRQMRRFRLEKKTKGSHINTGLWRYSRHPNYFGEITFWWGIWIMQTGIVQIPYTIIGPIAMTALFLFVSIPMMEKHVSAKYSGYEQYKKQVSMLIPWRNRLK